MTNATSPGSTRRERPAKPALTRAGIIDAALAILDDEGLGKVTMRRIATALDTGAASLYVYVRNTEDLHAQLLDALVGRIKPSARTGTWRERLHGLLVSYVEVLFAHPEIAQMAMTTHPSGPNYLAFVESILELLEEGGVDDGAAAWGIDLLLSAVTAVAVEHGGDRRPGAHAEERSELAATIAIVPSDRYPLIARLGDEMLSGTGPERFGWGIDVLLNGIVGTPR